jgi:hypothetical protein
MLDGREATMRAVPTFLALPACLAGLVATPAPARAEIYYQFQSPSGDIGCAMGSLGNKAFASCEVTDRTWEAPPRPDRCEGNWGDRITLNQGAPPTLVCSSDSLRSSDLPTLSFGSAWPVNPISCVSEPTGIACTDAGTGHYFRVARDSYELH